MMKHRIFANSILLLGTLSLGVVAGCSGGKTYGTGVSQESQLVSDLGGMLALGSAKKTNIDYSSRPKLVKAPTTASLPTPAEQVSGNSAYFPTNPEESRAKRLAALDDPDNVPLGADTRARDSGNAPAQNNRSNSFAHPDHADSAEVFRNKSVEGSKERLARYKELTQKSGLGVKPRKYLTQPPVEYRIPAATAVAGNVGEIEKNPNFKKVGHQSTEARP